MPGLGRYNEIPVRQVDARSDDEHRAEGISTPISRISPDDESRNIIRDISKDLNPYYGSIGRQGWIKSKTLQDIARLTFLAPQWLEGLIKKEISPIRLLTQPNRAFQGKDTTLRGIGRGLLAMVALTQVVNLITRGQPTWRNPEKEHKWDATSETIRGSRRWQCSTS